MLRVPVVGRKLIRGSCQLGVFDLAIRVKWAETIEVDPGDFGRLSSIISIATDERMNSDVRERKQNIWQVRCFGGRLGKAGDIRESSFRLR